MTLHIGKWQKKLIMYTVQKSMISCSVLLDPQVKKIALLNYCVSFDFQYLRQQMTLWYVRMLENIPKILSYKINSDSFSPIT